MKKSTFFTIITMAFCWIGMMNNDFLLYAKENLSVTQQIQTEEDDDEGLHLFHCPIFGDENYLERNNVWDKFKSKKYEQCMDGKMGDFEMTECTYQEIERQDVVLNQKYKKIMNALPKNEQILLRNYQREWIKEREKLTACYLPYGKEFSVDIAFQIGTISWLEESSSRLGMIVQRIDEFDQCLSSKKINRNSKGCENLYPLK